MTKKMIDDGINDFQRMYAKINKEINSIDKKNPSNIPGEIKFNTDNLESRIGKVENATDSIKRLLGICIFVLVVSIFTISIEIYRDNSLSSQFYEREIKLLEELKKFENKLVEIEGKQRFFEEYMNEKIENKINKGLMEYYN